VFGKRAKHCHKIPIKVDIKRYCSFMRKVYFLKFTLSGTKLDGLQAEKKTKKNELIPRPVDREN
jgi:hypothetical protein